MPATKRKYGVTKARSEAPLKRRKALRTYSGPPPLKFRCHWITSCYGLSRTALRYHETFDINPTVGGVPAQYNFRSNSCYDPNFSGIGHQPRGFDQIMSMYQYLAVREAQIEVWFTTSDGALVIVGSMPMAIFPEHCPET